MRTLPDGTQLVATQPISSKPEVCPRIDAPVPADVVVTWLRKFPGRRRHRSCRGLDVLTTKIRLLSAIVIRLVPDLADSQAIYSRWLRARRFGPGFCGTQSGLCSKIYRH